MKRFAFLATAAATLAIPASAMAANTGSGVVLSVQRDSIQVVNAHHVASAYRVRGGLSRIHTGSRITFKVDRKTISGVRVIGATKFVSYYAHVVRNSSGKLVLAIGDGNTVSFSHTQIKATKGHASHASQASHAVVAHAASGITLTVNAVPGTTVLVTETLGSDGSIAVTITVEAGSGPSGTGPSGGGSGSDDQIMDGVVTDVQVDSFGVINEDGAVVHFGMDPDALANIDMSPCDTVEVSYHADSDTLLADDVDDNGSSDAGACDSDGTYYPTQDESGPITSLSTTSITIDTSEEGSMTFPLIPSAELAAGYELGDTVDVSYSQDPDGSLYVTGIEYLENDSTGVVVSVSQDAVTIIDASTSQPDVFSADPSEQLFEGVAIGDEVDVTWHEATDGGSIADSVDDLGPANPSDPGTGGGDAGSGPA
ncbi:MAG: hypothetical protein ACLP22_14075 [Solirubrobacteraceae bacterium]